MQKNTSHRIRNNNNNCHHYQAMNDCCCLLCGVVNAPQSIAYLCMNICIKKLNIRPVINE